MFALVKFLWLTYSDTFDAQASSRLLSTTLAQPFLGRATLLTAGGVVMPLFLRSTLGAFVALLVAL